jgi:hypothetical protein
MDGKKYINNCGNNKDIIINRNSSLSYNEKTYNILENSNEYELKDTNNEVSSLKLFLYGEFFNDDSIIRIPLNDNSTNCDEQLIFEYKDKPTDFKETNVIQTKLYVCDINYDNKPTDKFILLINSITDIKLFKYTNKQYYVDRTFNKLNDLGLHKHSDTLISKSNNHGPRLSEEHNHPFFDDHHHAEVKDDWYKVIEDTSKFENNNVNDKLIDYKSEKKKIDKYVDLIISKMNKSHDIKPLLDSTNTGFSSDNKYHKHFGTYFNSNQSIKSIKSNDIKLKLKLRTILYDEFLKTSPLNPVKGLPCMYYSKNNCPINNEDNETGHCNTITDAEQKSYNLHSMCIPKTTKHVDTCLDLYGKNNCEQHYIKIKDEDKKQCIWSEWDGNNGKLGRCSQDGNVSKPPETCPDTDYLIKKYGKGELSNTMIDSICLPKNDKKKQIDQLLYNNPHYINKKNLFNYNGDELSDGDYKTRCKYKNIDDNLTDNIWNKNNCYNLKGDECHKNSKEVCEIKTHHYLQTDLIDKANELYDTHKNKICHWRPLHYSKDEDYNYTEKGICENLF